MKKNKLFNETEATKVNKKSSIFLFSLIYSPNHNTNNEIWDIYREKLCNEEEQAV